MQEQSFQIKFDQVNKWLSTNKELYGEHLSFLIFDIRNDVKQKPVFCYYDNKQSTVKEICSQLEQGLKVLLEESLK